MTDFRFDNFESPQLLEQALRHRSAGQPNNERLEFLGDSILGFLIAQALYVKFPRANEGQLTQARSLLVRESTLAEIAREQHIAGRIILGPGELKTGAHRRDSILADALEAIIAAKYLDAGISACQEMILQWFDSRMELCDVKLPGKDPKTRLQEWLQAKRHELPVYVLIAATGNEHEKQFEIQCQLPGLSIQTQGMGNSVKRAEASAAQLALQQLGLNK